jgi:hypothetical protein
MGLKSGVKEVLSQVIKNNTMAVSTSQKLVTPPTQK